jgi:hypothetical protein
MTVGFVHDETFVGVVRFGGVPLRGHWYDLRDLSLSPSVWQCSSGDDVMVEEEYSFVARSLHHAKKQVLQRQRERERERTSILLLGDGNVDARVCMRLSIAQPCQLKLVTYGQSSAYARLMNIATTGTPFGVNVVGSTPLSALRDGNYGTQYVFV